MVECNNKEGLYSAQIFRVKPCIECVNLLQWRHPTDLRSNDIMECPWQVEICARKRWVCMWSAVYARIYTGIQLESKLQQTGTWPSAAHPPRCLCCRTAVFSCQLRLTALSFLQGKFRRVFKYTVISFFYFFFFFEKCVTLKLPNLKLRNSGVCSDPGQINCGLMKCFEKARSWIQEGDFVSWR